MVVEKANKMPNWCNVLISVKRTFNSGVKLLLFDCCDECKQFPAAIYLFVYQYGHVCVFSWVNCFLFYFPCVILSFKNSWVYCTNCKPYEIPKVFQTLWNANHRVFAKMIKDFFWKVPSQMLHSILKSPLLSP